MQTRRRASAFALAALLAFGSAGVTACDKEDEADVREGVQDIQEGVEEGASEVEEGIDENVDSDGKDD